MSGLSRTPGKRVYVAIRTEGSNPSLSASTEGLNPGDKRTGLGRRVVNLADLKLIEPSQKASNKTSGSRRRSTCLTAHAA